MISYNLTKKGSRIIRKVETLLPEHTASRTKRNFKFYLGIVFSLRALEYVMKHMKCMQRVKRHTYNFWIVD